MHSEKETGLLVSIAVAVFEWRAPLVGLLFAALVVVIVFSLNP